MWNSSFLDFGSGKPLNRLPRSKGTRKNETTLPLPTTIDEEEEPVPDISQNAKPNQDAEVVPSQDGQGDSQIDRESQGSFNAHMNGEIKARSRPEPGDCPWSSRRTSTGSMLGASSHTRKRRVSRDLSM
jgi:hypothetical protein